MKTKRYVSPCNKDMKLLMENFRRFSQNDQDYGYMYIVENKKTKKVSFEEREKFCDNKDEFINEWFRSANYILKRLDNKALNEDLFNNKVTYWLSAQIPRILGMAGKSALKYFPKIASLAGKLGKSKTGKIMGQAALLAGLFAVFGGDAMAGGTDYAPHIDTILQAASSSPDLIDPELLGKLEAIQSYAGEGNPITQDTITMWGDDMGSMMTDAIKSIKSEAGDDPKLQKYLDKLFANTRPPEVPAEAAQADSSSVQDAVKAGNERASKALDKKLGIN